MPDRYRMEDEIVRLRERESELLGIIHKAAVLAAEIASRPCPVCKQREKALRKRMARVAGATAAHHYQPPSGRRTDA